MTGNPTAKTLGAILCGGASRRFGSDKAEAKIEGRTLLDWSLANQQGAFGTPVLVLSGEMGRAVPGIEVVRDLLANRGPAGGIHAALSHAATGHFAGVWITPCDAPFAQPELGRELAAMARAGTLAVFPESRGPLGFEPLFGWYSAAAREPIERLIADGPMSMADLTDRIGPTVRLPIAEVEKIAPADFQFLNINTTADMELARELLTRRNR